MAVLRKRIAAGLTLLRSRVYPSLERGDQLCSGEREVWIGVGGNLGDPLRRFHRLWTLLKRRSDLRPLEASPILINPPFGYLDQPDFHNAVLRIATRLEPEELLRRLLEIERRFGRRRSFKDAPRTLDLDILFYGERRFDRPDLQIPHPRWRERISVTIPLALMSKRPKAAGDLPRRLRQERRARRRGVQDKRQAGEKRNVPSQRSPMVEETFEAPTPKKAFALAKEKYGRFSDLQLLRARQVMGRDGKLVAEITVAVPQSDYLASIGIDESEALMEEIAQLRNGIDRMRELAGLESTSREAVERVLTLLEEKGIRRAWLMQRLEPMLGTAVAEDEQLLLSYLLEEIDEGLTIREENLGRPRVMMMVGPTGVGKTTTIAKMAARFSYMLERDYRVALVNLDTYRAGAYEQLDNFARLLGLEHRRAESVERFAGILDELSDYDVVLVDTAGISPYDTDRLIKTIEFLKSVRDREISTQLVVAATAKYEDIREIYEHFSFINIESVIVTKFDETRRVGDLIAFLTEKHLPVSYLSTGQRVPDDLEPAAKERILEQFLGEIDG